MSEQEAWATVAKAELIDTLWNVNVLDNKFKTGAAKELIDTLWNVNFDV